MVFLLACAPERGPRPPEDEISYGGWLYDGPLYEGVVSEGTLTFDSVDAEPVLAEQPYEGYGGYWVVTLPPSTPFELRVEGATAAYPTVWAGDTPASDGSWLPGALFAGQVAYFDALVAGLALEPAPGALSSGATHLWGMPADGGTWDCAELSVQAVAPLCYEQLDDGTFARVESGPLTWFFAFDLEPGSVDVAYGGLTVETWNARAGDLVMAFWLERE